ncbi:MAG: acireductone synthase, partial [Bdellovibrionota bacterium]
EVKLSIQKIWHEDLGGAKGSEPDLKAVTDQLHSWIDKDVKQPILKSLQGKIWKSGYESGSYKGHVYSEVANAFAAWRSEGKNLSIYSSGSVEAQKLLFKYSEAGDLTKMLDRYFDTEVGHKREAKSYATIAERLALAPSEIVFLSDIKEELDAARDAGMKTIQLLRDPLPTLGDHPTAKDFDEVSKIIKAY